MLESLFGNSVIEKILFYLYVNGSCYPSELTRKLGGSLYSYQLALARLEKGGIIAAQKKGRTLVYQFNPRYPFLTELRAFLSKAYTFYPPQLRLKYFEPAVRSRSRRQGKPL